jgi:hypothetical protein
MNKDPSRPKNDLLRIAGFSTALGLGFMAASVQAYTWDAAGLRFRFSLFTVIAFVAGALVGWYYWRTVSQMIYANENGTPPERRAGARKFTIFSILLFAFAIGSYVYRLRLVPSGKAAEVAEGLVMAFVAIGIVGFLLWRVVRFFEKEP